MPGGKRSVKAMGTWLFQEEGGYKNMVQSLRKGTDIGILFDQNVTRNHALFTNWFGKQAATTKALPLAALRTEAHIFVVTIVRRGVDDYLYECIECDCSDIYRNEKISKEDKLIEITEATRKGIRKTYLEVPRELVLDAPKMEDNP